MIDGWEITNYLGVVSSRLVAGVGLLSEIAADFTDIFGGRSASYQQHLKDLERDAIREITWQTQSLGGNWVVGLHLDFDSISGGKQMLMLTAYGTAVHAVRTQAIGTDHDPLRSNVSIVTRAQRTTRARQTVLAIQRDTRLPTQSEWAVMAAQPVVEAVPLAIELYLLGVRDKIHDSPTQVRHAADLLRLLPFQAVQQTVLQTLESEISSQAQSALLRLCRQLSLADYLWVRDHIGSDDSRLRRLAMRVFCSCAARVVDAEVVKEIRSRVVALPETARMSEYRGILSKTPEPRWRCENGHDSVLDVTHCSMCGLDRYGFAASDFGRDFALKLADELLSELSGAPPNT